MVLALRSGALGLVPLSRIVRYRAPLECFAPPRSLGARVARTLIAIPLVRCALRAAFCGRFSPLSSSQDPSGCSASRGPVRQGKRTCVLPR